MVRRESMLVYLYRDNLIHWGFKRFTRFASSSKWLHKRAQLSNYTHIYKGEDRGRLFVLTLWPVDFRCEWFISEWGHRYLIMLDHREILCGITPVPTEFKHFGLASVLYGNVSIKFNVFGGSNIGWTFRLS